MHHANTLHYCECFLQEFPNKFNGFFNFLVVMINHILMMMGVILLLIEFMVIMSN